MAQRTTRGWIDRAFVLLVAFCLSGCAVIGLPTVHGCLQKSSSPSQLTVQGTARLIAIGDFGINRQDRNKIVAAAVRSYLANAPEVPTTVVLLGDNFYPKGLAGTEGRCDTLDDAPHRIARQLDAVLEPYAFLRDRRIPVKAVAGNHDHGCGLWGLENQKNIDRFLPSERHWGGLWDFHYGLPRAVPLPGGELQLVLLDSEAMLQDFQMLESSLRRMGEILEAGSGSGSWQVVVAHHPLRTLGTHDGAFPDGLRKPLSFALFPVHFLAAARLWPFSDLSQEAYSFRYQRYRRELERAFDRHPGMAALFLAGHDHSLQVFEPGNAGMPLEVVVGSGAYCSPVRKDKTAAFAAAKHGFAAITFARDRLEVELYGTTACVDEEICSVGTGTPVLLYKHMLLRSGADVGLQHQNAHTGFRQGFEAERRPG